MRACVRAHVLLRTEVRTQRVKKSLDSTRQSTYILHCFERNTVFVIPAGQYISESFNFLKIVNTFQSKFVFGILLPLFALMTACTQTSMDSKC